jgi:hypothetical protein
MNKKSLPNWGCWKAQDSEKLIELIKEINRLLEEKEQRLAQQRKQRV